MRILTLFLRYGTSKFPDAEARLDELFAAQLPEVERTTVVVDSALPADFVERHGHRRTVVGADNTFSEWSAADRAIAFVGNEIWSYDLVHLATAAFNTLYTRYLERIDTSLLRAILGRPCCLGHLDYYNEPVRVLTFRSQHWVRTSFVFLAPAELKALRSLVSFSEPSLLFSGDPRRPFQADAPLSESYKRYIYDWLVGADIGQGVRWHSGAPLDAGNLAAFERKTLAILNEHLLSIRLRALGCKLIDVTFLASHLARSPHQEVAWHLDWRRQLAARDVDRVEPDPEPARTVDA